MAKKKTVRKKTGQLTKVEKFYIDNNLDKTVDEIATDLNRSNSIVDKYLSSTDKEADKKPEDTEIQSLFARKEDRGVTMMTPNASQVADETRSSRIVSEPSRHNAIYIINKDK